MQNGVLWGMVACHHMQPKRASIAMREAAIFISRMVSAKLSSIAALAQRAKVEKANSMVSALLKSMATDEEASMMHKLLPQLMDLQDATGVVVLIEGQLHLHGATPELGATRALLAWLAEKPSGDIFSCDNLGQQFAPALEYSDVVSGVLTTALTPGLRSGIVWLRKEKPGTVNWAGNYQSGLTQNSAGNYRLTPRKSFEIWTQVWCGRSEPWSASDKGLAGMLALSIPDALVHKNRADQDQRRRKQEHAASLASVQQFKAMTAAVPGVVYQFVSAPESPWKFVYLSKGVVDLFGVSTEAVLHDHSTLTNCVLPEDWAAYQAAVAQASASGSLLQHEHRIKTPSGSLKWVKCQATPQLQADGSILWSGILSDITSQKKAESILQMSASVFEHTQESIVITDAHRRIVAVNQAFVQASGYSREEVLGQNPRLLNSGQQTPEFYCAMWDSIDNIGFWSGELWNRHKNGALYAALLNISAVRNGHAEVTHYVGLSSEITHIKQRHERMERIAHFDALTGIPNRVLLADRLTHAIAQARRNQELLAVCYLDLDGFKLVNDTFGHEVGDQVLIEVVRRINTTIRAADTVARLGGDEFVIVLPGLQRVQEFESMVERLLTEIAQPMVIGQARCHVGASIGVSIFPNHASDSETLLHQADQAMYSAKHAGKNCYRLHQTA
jgi:diguanylate cyclase (GGDEF)-like protein/PAS domain S-box-containing protein